MMSGFMPEMDIRMKLQNIILYYLSKLYQICKSFNQIISDHIIQECPISGLNTPSEKKWG